MAAQSYATIIKVTFHFQIIANKIECRIQITAMILRKSGSVKVEMSETRPYIYRVISPQHTAPATLSSLFSFDAQEHKVKKHFPSCVCHQIIANHGWRDKKELPISVAKAVQENPTVSSSRSDEQTPVQISQRSCWSLSSQS